MKEKREALRIEILKYIEKHSRVDLGELVLTIGMIQDMYTEALNDQEPYAIVATQEHFDAF